MRLNKLHNQILSIMLIFSLVFAPARRAEAIIPLLAPLAISAVSTTGLTFTAADVIGLSIALAGSAAIAYMNLTAPDGSQVRIPFQDTTAKPAAAPPAPVLPSGTVQIPYTISQSCINMPTPVGHSCLPGNHTYADVCASIGGIIPVGGYACTAKGVNDGGMGYSQTTVCPPGSVNNFNRGVCLAYPGGGVSPYAAVADKNQDFTRTNNTFAPIPNDLVGSLTATQGTNGDLLIYGQGSNTSVTCNGSPCTNLDVYHILQNGGTVATSYGQRYDTAGTPYVAEQTLTTNATGQVVSTTTTNISGTVNSDPATASATPVIPAAAGAVPAVPTAGATNPATTVPPITFPTDYNREVTQGQIRDYLNPATVPLDIAPTDAQPITDLATARNGFTTDINNMPTTADPVVAPSFGLNFSPFTPTACTPLSYSFGSSLTAGSHTVNLDVCPMVPTIQRIGAWAIYLLTAGILFAMFTRRQEGQ